MFFLYMKLYYFNIPIWLLLQNDYFKYYLFRAISFVGGDAAGRHIYQRGSNNGKRVQCNMGAKVDYVSCLSSLYWALAYFIS